MEKLTQKEIVKDILRRDGVIDNFWCINNYILRLGAIICDLQKEGWKFERKWGENEHRKNSYYYVKVQGGDGHDLAKKDSRWCSVCGVFMNHSKNCKTKVTLF